MSSEPGPAYPCEWNYIGMTLRDYFAAKAMAAVLNAVVAKGVHTSQEDAGKFAIVAYAMADAMLAARAKP